MHWINDFWDLQEEISLLKLKKANTTDNAATVALKQRINEKEAHKQGLIDLVSLFKGLDNKILVLKYIYGMKLDDVAEELGYSISHVRKRHAEIMKSMKLAENYKRLKAR